MKTTLNITKIPLKTAMEIYDLSKTSFYKLIEERVLTPFYFKGGSTKPFFCIRQIEEALRPEPGGGTKRKKTGR